MTSVKSPIGVKQAYSTFFNMSENMGAAPIARTLMGKTYDEMRDFFTKEVDADVTQSLMALVVVGVVLMVMGIILGNLEAPLTSSIPDNSSFAGLKTSIPSNLTSAMNVAVIIPIILAAVLILGVVYMLAQRG